MKLSLRFIVVAAVVLAVLGAAALILPQILAPESRGVGVALKQLPQLYPSETQPLGEVVLKTYWEYRTNSTWWSAVYFTCLFGSAFLSALAGLVLKLELLQAWPRFRNDLAATAAVLAALLITLSTAGDFQRKWQANRIAAAAMENLAYELVTPKTPADLHAVIVEIQAINEARNKGIVGEQPGGHSGALSRSQGGAQPDGAADVPQALRR